MPSTAIDTLAPGDLITEAEAAVILRVEADTLRNWRRNAKKGRKRAPPYFQPHPHGRVLYSRAALAEWVKKHSTESK